MTMPLSGEIAMNQINAELGRTSTAQISLDTAENGGYATINTNSRSYPNASNPAALTEWYGYNHRASPPATFTPLPEVGYAGSTSTTQFWLDQACRNSISSPGRYWGTTESLVESAASNQLYTNSTGTTFPPAGYYAQYGVEAIYWNGNSGTSIQICRI